jgi:hypothetical protein
MGQRKGETDQRQAIGIWFVAAREAHRFRYARFATLIGLIGLMLACIVVLAGASQANGECPNEARRVEQGSTYLPDCRAYEQVTPVEKGATQALSPNGGEFQAIPAIDGERLALHTQAYLGDEPGSLGTNVVFSRGASGWEMVSLQLTDAGETNFIPSIFTPDLTQIGIEVYSNPGKGEGHSSTQTFEVGSPGGPYSVVATTSSKPSEEGKAALESLIGASNNFSHVVLSSLDDSLLPSAAGAADQGVPNLYDWVGGKLNLVNVVNDGTLVSQCGAVLGYGRSENISHENDAVSGEGLSSRIFFTSPGHLIEAPTGSGCTEGESEGGPPPQNPHRLYMRVNDSETVEVSAPQLEGATPCDPGTWSAYYQGASADGSKVFFTTESELTPDHTACREPRDMELYEYNTATRKLIRISRGESGTALSTVEGHVQELNGQPAVISEDGSTVYFVARGQLTPNAPSGGEKIYCYDTLNDTIRLVAVVLPPPNNSERAYTTPNGEFYLFPSEGVAGEPRGEHHNEIYRYDSDDGSVMCVSCGSAVAPVHGIVKSGATGILYTGDITPKFIPMSDNGQFVFFNSTARLVPRDTNSATEEEETQAVPKDQDVYEWEADGTEGEPSVFCREVNGCVHLITSGKDENTSLLLGASSDGSNVFFETSARLVPQDMDDLPDIYDARIGGGFAAPVAPVRCSGESCRLIPSASPVISTPLSATFSGVGNLMPPVSKPAVKSKSLTQAQKLSRALKTCRTLKKKQVRARCKAQARKRYGAKVSERERRGDR